MVPLRMPQTVEINLRLPSLRIKPTGGEEAKVIDNSGLRFVRQIECQSVPKVGESINMSAGSVSFPCQVVQVNWHESKNIFVVACKYGWQRILAEDYLAIVHAPDWEGNALL